MERKIKALIKELEELEKLEKTDTVEDDIE